MLYSAYDVQNAPNILNGALLAAGCSDRRAAIVGREIGALARVDPLVRCDAAKGFACLGQLGKLTGRGKLSGDPLP